MSLFKPGKNKHLNEILERLYMDCSNNYKDAAQADWQEFKEAFERCRGALKNSEKNFYQSKYDEYSESMLKYHH